MGQVRLCIEEYLVTRQQLQAAVGDQRSVPAADHDDDRLSGNAQIPQRGIGPAVPGGQVDADEVNVRLRAVFA